MNTEDKISAATNMVLAERGLSNRVKIDLVQRQLDSDRYDVDLNVDASEFPRFIVDPKNALADTGGVGLTPDSFVPLGAP
jgi:hypothetical protein